MIKKVKPEILYKQYMNRAIKKNIPFTLNLATFVYITEQTCIYCNSFCLKRTMGVDRVDNGDGYTSTNSVPCCWECNRSKSNMSLFEYKAYVDKFRKPNINNDQKLYYQVVITDTQLLLRFPNDYLFTSEEKANGFRLKMEVANSKPNSTKIVKVMK